MQYWVLYGFDLGIFEYYATLVGSYAWEPHNRQTRCLDNYKGQVIKVEDTIDWSLS